MPSFFFFRKMTQIPDLRLFRAYVLFQNQFLRSLLDLDKVQYDFCRSLL